MYCAECGNVMEQRLDGSRLACCNGYGYWDDLEPLPKDKWLPITKKGKYYFFPTVKWPASLKPTLPKDN